MPLAVPQAWVWQRRRLWYQATSHPLLQQAVHSARLAAAATSAAEVQVQCSLRRPALAYLQGHSVHGRAAAPNCLLLEMASAAGQLLWSQEHSPVAATAATFQRPLLLAAAAEGTVACSIKPSSGLVRLSSPAATLAAAVHADAQLQKTGSAGPEEQQLTAVAAAAGTSAADARRASWRLAAALVTSRSPAAGSSAAFAAVLTEQHQHAGYWIHPAAADASLQLAAALQAHAAGSTAAQLLAPAAVGAYAPMQRLAGAAAYAAAAAGPASATSSHWLSSGSLQLLTIIEHQAKAVAALQSLAAAAVQAAAAAAARPPWLPASLPAAPAGMALVGSAASLAGIQQQLAEVVESVLGRDDVPPDQPLMEAGLDSIGEGLQQQEDYFAAPFTDLHALCRVARTCHLNNRFALVLWCRFC